MSGEDQFFQDTGGNEAADPMVAAAPVMYVDAGSAPPVAYSVPEPGAYDLGAAGGDEQSGGGGGGDPFGVGGDGEQLGGGGVKDQFSGMPLQASSTPYQPKPTDAYSLEEAAAVMESAQSQFDAAVKERADKEAAKAEEVKKLAEEELDGFYDERTDEVARRQARSREQEETFLKGVSASIEGSASNPWARICELVDLKKPVVPSKPPRPSSAGAAGASGGGSGSGSGSRRGSAVAQSHGMDEEEVFRATEKMRSLIIQMKADTAEGNAGDDTG
eukprot:g14059.t1